MPLSRREVEHTNIQICMVVKAPSAAGRHGRTADASNEPQWRRSPRLGALYIIRRPSRLPTEEESQGTCQEPRIAFAIRLQAQGRRAGPAAGMKQIANGTGNKGARALARQTRAIEKSPYFLTSLTGLSCTPAPACETNPMGCCPVIV